MKWWRRLSPYPGGKWFFSFLLGRMIPYTGSVRPRVLALSPGLARVTMKDRRAVRNHLKSIHAIAQMNLAEMSTGLAMTTLLSKQGRAIITELKIEFLKKARGPLIAECRCSPFDEQVSQDYQVTTSLTDASGDLVSKASATWLVGPKKAS